MNNIHIKGTKDVYFVPEINFNTITGVCEISGESFLEDTLGFYQPLQTWLEKYLRLRKPITVTIRLSYFNTNSARCILDILKLLRIYEFDGGEVTVNWYYQEDDIEMRETIEDFITDTGLRMNIFKEKRMG